MSEPDYKAMLLMPDLLLPRRLFLGWTAALAGSSLFARPAAAEGPRLWGLHGGRPVVFYMQVAGADGVLDFAKVRVCGSAMSVTSNPARSRGLSDEALLATVRCEYPRALAALRECAPA